MAGHVISPWDGPSISYYFVRFCDGVVALDGVRDSLLFMRGRCYGRLIANIAPKHNRAFTVVHFADESPFVEKMSPKYPTNFY